MYQPKIRDDQVRQLYMLAKSTNKPMTKLIREAVDEFLAKGTKEAKETGKPGPPLTQSVHSRSSCEQAEGDREIQRKQERPCNVTRRARVTGHGANPAYHNK